MKTLRKRAVLVLSILFCLGFIAGFAFAEPSVNVYLLNYDGISEQNAGSINEAVFSFISELKDYKINDCRTFPVPVDFSSVTSDFMFYGKITGTDKSVNLQLILRNVTSGTTRLLSKEYANINLILIESRTLVKNLFDQSYILEAPSKDNKNNQDSFEKDGIIGRWKGEKDVKSITLLPNNRGIIVFDNNISISVETVLKGNKLTIKQRGQVSERQFEGLPLEAVKKALAGKPVFVWHLEFFPAENKISGKRVELKLIHDGKTVKKIEEAETLVTWFKL